MKKHFLLLFLGAIVSVLSIAQTQNSFKYQAVLRGSEGEIIVDESIIMRISILQGSETGNSVYTEEHNITTNSFGVIVLNVGDGSVLSGSFGSISWGTDSYYLQMELNRNNSEYINMGTAMLLSVPYALHAQTVSNSDDADADPANEIQDLQLAGNVLKITNNSIATEVDLSKYENTNTDNQQLSLIGTELAIDNGNAVDLAVIQDGTDDADADPANELQDISISNDTIYLTDGGSVKLPAATTGFSGSYTDLTDKPTLAGDASGSLDDVTIEKIQGQNISAGSPSTGQVLKWNGSAWAPGSDATTSGGGVDGVVETISVTGTTTKTITLGMSADAASSTLTADFSDEVDDADANATNEIQDLSLLGNILTITNNGTATNIDLTPYLDNTDTQLNETQVDNYVANNGYLNSFTEVDGSITNEIQDLSLSGNILTITNNGSATSIDLSPYLDNTDTQLLEIQVDDFVANNGYQLASADGDISSTNEIQTLGILGDTISLTEGGKVTLPNKGWGSLSDEALFAVVNTSGDTVFAVYESGVRIYVDNDPTKAARGGFAVASSRPGGKGETVDILSVMPDSVRIYLNEDITNPKAARGGFAVASSRPGGKGITQNILSITEDSVRIYIQEDTTETKAARGGFAVASSRPGGKGEYNEILRINEDSVRIYLDESTPSKAARGGFAVASSRPGGKGAYSNVMTVNGDSTRIYTADSVAGFGVQNTSRGTNERIMNLTPDNYFIGHESGFSSKPGVSDLGRYNSYIGYQTGYKNETGRKNIFIGYLAGYANTDSYNVFIGNEAGTANIGGGHNVFVGNESGKSNTEGGYNMFMGYKSGQNNIGGDGNTFLGYQCGRDNTEGNRNIFIGYASGLNNETANDNVFIGNASGYNNLTGIQNLYLGYQAGYNEESGEHNVFLGYRAGRQNESGSRNVFIGHEAGYNEMDSDKLYIENSDSPTPLIYGDFDTDEVVINGDLDVIGALTNTSDKRYKKDIVPITNVLKSLQSLNGIYYYWNITDFPDMKFNKRKQIGVLAQDVEKVYPELVYTKSDGYKTVDYTKLTAVLIEAAKEQQKIIEKQQESIENMEKENASIKQENDFIKAELDKIKVHLNMQ